MGKQVNGNSRSMFEHDFIANIYFNIEFKIEYDEDYKEEELIKYIKEKYK